MDSPIQEQLSPGELLSKIVGYLYANSRPQFHPALYVLIYAALWVGAMQLFVLLISLTPWASLALDYLLLGILAGCIGLAELVRGHVKHWLGYGVEDWCYVAMAIGGAVFGGSFAGLMFLMWGVKYWYEPVLFVSVGVGVYTLLGWLFHMHVKTRSKQLEADSRNTSSRQ